MKKLLISLLYCSLLVFFVDVQSGVPTTPMTKNGESKFEIGISSSTAYYKIKNCSFNCDLNISDLKITALKTYNFNSKVDIYSSVATHIFGNIDSSTFSVFDSPSYELGLGIRGELFNSDKMRVITYSKLKYISIKNTYYDGDGMNPPDPAISGMEGSIGIVAITNISNKLSIYSGIETNPFNNMKVSGRYYFCDDYYDCWEAKNKDHLKNRKPIYLLGYNYKVNNKQYISGEISIGGEKSSGVKIGFIF